MDRLKKVLAALLIITVVLLPLAGCQDKGEHPSEHPAKEAPAEEAAEAAEEAAAAEHPAGEHPSGEHPK